MGFLNFCEKCGSVELKSSKEEENYQDLIKNTTKEKLTINKVSKIKALRESCQLRHYFIFILFVPSFISSWDILFQA
jgi:hypothetical protein